jgi:hypothetical protein
MSSNVRFWGQSGHWAEIPECLLLSQSGHGSGQLARSLGEEQVRKFVYFSKCPWHHLDASMSPKNRPAA